jgi:solute carrier family 25 carnitine/acylcarnitine transporter 20/29
MRKYQITPRRETPRRETPILSLENCKRSQQRMTQNILVSGASGAAGGMLSAVIGHPFDTLKSRMQTNTFKKHGFRNIYSGFRSHMSIQVISNTLLFGIYDQLQLYLFPTHTQNKQEPCYTAAFLTGLIEGVLYTPMENYKVRQQLGLSSPKLRDLTQGMRQCMVRDGIGNCAYFGSYFAVKNKSLEMGWDPTYSILLGGGISGINYWILMHPVDTYKTLLQSNMTHVLDNMRTSQKIRYLYSGLYMSVLRSIPINCGTFYGYEMAREYFSRHLQ